MQEVLPENIVLVVLEKEMQTLTLADEHARTTSPRTNRDELSTCSTVVVLLQTGPACSVDRCGHICRFFPNQEACKRSRGSAAHLWITTLFAIH